MTKNQQITFWTLLLISIILKLILIPCNMMDMGDSATRVWNALWWAQSPFFVLPESGHPFWFYFMGIILMVTQEIFYTPIITMIILMTIAGIYLFKTALLLSDFRTAIITFCIFILNPVIFRLNFEPYAQQTYLTATCVMIYYLVKAISDNSLSFPRKRESSESFQSNNSNQNFLIAGIFAFIASFSRPEAIFILAPLCIVAYIANNIRTREHVEFSKSRLGGTPLYPKHTAPKRHGYLFFISLALLFQVLWIIVSIVVYGSPFKTFQTVEQYGTPADIQSISMGLRLKGLFLPYYFLVVGLTIIIFYFFVKGLILSWKRYPKIILAVLIIPILIPALANGAASFKSPLYHTTHYIYLMFFYGPVFAAIGLNDYISRFKTLFLRVSVCSVVILSCIPLSYIKDFVPQKYNKLFPKVVQFIVTAEDPAETRNLIQFVDENINEYPALIFDAAESESSIFYVPFRTHLAPPEKILISNYNIAQDKESMKKTVSDFMAMNKKGIVMVKKEGTLLAELLPNLSINHLTKKQELNKWVIYTYQ